MKIFLVKRNRLVVYFIVTILFFLARSIFFANNYGGVEHDSGWYLGVAKNLATRGIYASYTNTVTEDGVGAFPSIHGRFSVQDNQGFTYFPAGVTAGPGYIIPEAAIIKIFGNDFWQYRAWPLAAFTGLLILLFYFVWRIGGFISLVIFQVWLWAVPQLYITFSYEAYSEHIALLYLLISFLFFKRNPLLSGLFLSFAILTKNIIALSALSYLIFFIYEIYLDRTKPKFLIYRWGSILLGTVSPILIFELYRYIYLTSHFGIEGWQAVNKDIELTFKNSGSGISNLTSIDWHAVANKTKVLLSIGVQNNPLIWVFVIFSPILIYKLSKKNLTPLLLLHFTATVSLTWFIFISPYGWVRHTWQSLPLVMILVSTSLGLLLQSKFSKPVTSFLVLFFLVLMIDLNKTEPGFLISQKTLAYWDNSRYSNGIQLLPHLPTFSVFDQIQTINFFKENINEHDRIYYVGGLLVAELSPLVDKVFYPIARYGSLRNTNPDGGSSYLIFGPYQKLPLSIVGLDHIEKNFIQYCSEIIFNNPSYTLCRLQ